MNLSVSNRRIFLHSVLIDLLLLGTICIVPAISHMLAFPLWQFNPMLFCLMAGMVLVRDRRNAYLLAVLLPVVSMLVSGMPTPMKTLCMVPEMLTVVALFHLLEKKFPIFVSMFIAMIAGKLVFYGLKIVIIAPVVLIGTSLWIQLAVLLLYCMVFSLVKRL